MMVKLTGSLPEPLNIPAEEPQTTLSNLPSSTSPLRSALLRAWLDVCNELHPCRRQPQGSFPTRLLGLSNSDSLKLVSGQEVSSQPYIALSHCWGELAPGEIPWYCTTDDNISSREEGSQFRVSDLPLTFRDAIEVSQGLGIHYLWVDSLCIIQGSKEDWTKESKRMEDVYAGAYCTIAATSAANSHEGFLRRDMESDHVYVHNKDNPSQQAYIRTKTTNFSQEIESAPLNQRAWVLQERLLSCRTIHFGSREMYFECGQGRYGEDLTRMERYDAPDLFFN